jgi:hypothetical protein
MRIARDATAIISEVIMNVATHLDGDEFAVYVLFLSYPLDPALRAFLIADLLIWLE